jgi:hypothetical protein
MSRSNRATAPAKATPLSANAQQIIAFLKANDGKPTKRADLAMTSDVFVAARAELVRLPSLPIPWRIWLHSNRS